MIMFDIPITVRQKNTELKVCKVWTYLYVKLNKILFIRSKRMETI